MNNLSPAITARVEWSGNNVGRWLITVCWAVLIFYLSTAGFGTGFTSLLLSDCLRLLHLNVAPGTFAVLHFLFRKSAHVTEYCIFSLLIYASLLRAKDYEWHARKALWSVLIAGGYSLTDEFHQIFVPGRTAALHDCAIDTAGAIVGVAVVYACDRIRRKRKKRPESNPARVERVENF